MLDHVLEDEEEEVDGFDKHTDFALLQMLQISGSNEIVSCFKLGFFLPPSQIPFPPVLMLNAPPIKARNKTMK